jgi:hypothetical protein
VEAIQADMGGTEIYQALSKTLASRSQNIPTVVIVLTDGEVFVHFSGTSAVLRFL